MTTDVPQFISELDAGVFEEKLSRQLSDVAGAVVDHDKPGSITIKFDISRIGSSHQVKVEHKLTYSRPTGKGKITEENKTVTPMHVGVGGALTLFPPDQTQMFDKRGEVKTRGE